MKLYGFDKSRALRILWMFNELQVDYEYIKINGREELFSDWFVKLNPAGKVPVLVDNDLVLTESGAILTYLGDKFPEKGLVPPCGSQQRAIYNQWCFFCLSELEQPLWLMAKHSFVFPEKIRKPEINRSVLIEYRQILDVLAKGLEGKTWILGDDFSAADILIINTLYWGQETGIKLKNQTLKQYYERGSSREAFIKSIE